MEPTVGEKRHGSVVTNIERELSVVRNGKARVRLSVELQNGMIVVEDFVKEIAEIEKEDEKRRSQKKEKNSTDKDEAVKRRAAAKEAIRKRKEEEAALKLARKAEEEDEEACRQQHIEKEKEKARRKKEQEEKEELARREAEVARQQLEEEEQQKRKKLAEEEELRKHRELEEEMAQKKREEQDEKIRKSQEAMLQRKKEADARRAAEKKAKEIARKHSAIQVSWKPEVMWVYVTRARKGLDHATKSAGLWTSKGGEAISENWVPQEVIVYPPGKEPTVNRLQNSALPHGVWCYSADTEPDKGDKEWTPKNHADILVYPPGEVPANNSITGVWTFNPSALNAKWPPPTSTTDNNSVGPKRFVIYPKSSMPKKSSIPIGEWVNPRNAQPLDDKSWQPQEILVYPDFQQSAKIEEAMPYGVWGLSTESTACEDAEFDPTHILVCPPDMQPTQEDGWKPKGIWMYPPNSLNRVWPPPSTSHKTARNVSKLPNSSIFGKSKRADNHHRLAKVMPKNAVSLNTDPTIPCGVWVFSSGEEDTDEWMPVKVEIFEQGEEPADLPVFGLWGFSNDVTQDNDKGMSPMGMLFFGPGDEPPDDFDWQPRGCWAPAPGEKSFDWPPPSKPINEKARADETAMEYPKMARVVPKSQAETITDHSIPHGVWMCCPAEIDNDDWMPMDVAIYEQGQEPQNLPVLGLWGYSTDEPADMEEENSSPMNLLFFGPGEDPPADLEWQPQGCWGPPPESTNFAWPPPLKPATDVAEHPKLAIVVPKSQASTNNDSAVPQGVWMYSSGEEVDDGAWMPAEVAIFEQGEEPQDLPISGLWGYSSGAEPDEDGNFSPSDMLFFAPGDDPPDDFTWQPKGCWGPSPGKENVDWLPPKEAHQAQKLQIGGKEEVSRKARKMVERSEAPEEENLVKPTRRCGVPKKMPSRAFVYPKSKSPKVDSLGAADGNAIGVWTSEPVSEADENVCFSELLLHETGEEPRELKSDKVPHGLWGYGKEGEPMWFSPPNEPPPDGCQPAGTWSCQKGARNEERVHYRFEGAKVVYTKTTEIHYMGTKMTFQKEWEE